MDTSQRASICRTSATDSAASYRNCLIADAKAGQAAETTAAPGLQPGDRRPDIRGGILAPPTRTDEAHRGAFAPAQTARSSHSPDGRKWHNATKINDSGQTLLEFALGLMIFLVLVFGTMDFASLLYHKVTLQNAARQAGRYAITGQCLLNSNGACSMSRYLSIQRVLEACFDWHHQ